MIDYSLAGEFAGYVHALFIVESNEQPLAVGDGGRALGYGQMHPAFFQEFYGHSHRFPRSVSHTWEQAWIVTAASFFDFTIAILGLERAVQAYNQGVQAVLDGTRAPEYLERFQTALASIQSGRSNAQA